MIKQYNEHYATLLRIGDAIAIGTSWVAAYFLRFYAPIIEVTKGLPPFDRYAALTPWIVLLWIASFSFLGLYSQAGIKRKGQELKGLLRCQAFTFLIFLGLTYAFVEFRYSRVMLFFFGTIGFFLLLSLRQILRIFLPQNSKKIVIIGNGVALNGLVSRFQSITNQESYNRFSIMAVLGPTNYSGIGSWVETHHPDLIVIALKREEYSNLNLILAQIQDETIDIHVVPDVHEFLLLGCEVEDFEGMPVVHINHSPLDGGGTILKRITDIVLALAAIIFFTPFLFLIALLIKLTSRGPLFYSQERVGLDGEVFRMLKFRSMHSNAEEKTGAVWATHGDQRTTAIGKILRATSLDELPQLYNVLMGDMSLVGPRPERPIFVEKFRKVIPHYMLRHKVKAGLTGWAQVNGWRGNTSLEKRIEHDLFYIRNWSYILDLKILFLTLWKGFINKNAY